MSRRAALVQLAVWCVLVAGLAVMWLRYGASTTTTLLTVLSGAAALTQLLAATRWSRDAGTSSAAQLDDAADTLAWEVRRQWEAEARRRLLDDGQRLPVRCRTGRTVVDLTTLVTDYAEAPRRLVVVGEPGAGKTGLCVLLLLELLRRPTIARVPVLLQVSAWNPKENLDAWLMRSILETYPFLGNESRFGATAVRDLLAKHRILPVLDGLDEMADRRRGAALRALDSDRGVAEPLVLTCRSGEFDRANAGGPIRESQVVTLLPLEDDAVAGYLLDSAASDRLEQWEQVLDRLSDRVSDPLAEALRTPLMLSLARTTYSEPDTDPAELLELDTPERVEARLLDEFTRQAFVTRPPSPLSTPARAPRRWHPARAERWLAFLARLDERELAWWQLWRTVPRWVFVANGIMVGGTLSTLLGWLLLGLFGRPGLGALLGLAVGVGGGALLGLLPAEAPRRFVPRILRRNEVGRDLMFGLIGAAAGGIAVAAVYGVAYGAVVGLVFGVAFGVIRRFTEPTEPKEAVTPDTLVRGDRRAVLSAAVLGAVLGAAVGGTLAGVLGAANLAVPVEHPVLVALLGVGVGAVLGAGGLGLVVHATSASGRFNTTRIWLALRGSTPLRLMSFLADAHRLGVLRLAGPYYQFRHELLRDRLALRR
ncbi:hypothetical protein [Actinophytocola xanthii]|uniref:NACHT domain-containing protein n=1 Tax=Actinophytocola xanthii TaxID=1912961 RepID=A0A1Q8CXU5_9PSEU|nr:hypothetical protein [Actinophytocola xanthii]OLF19169.1 hypothetical protein BU204_02030 [Actinophytocola xanthii]